MARSCPACGAPAQGDERFCGECGASLVGSSISHEPALSFSGARPAFPSTLAGGRYQLRTFLGEGGRKRVYLAKDARLDRDVAIAIIKTEGLDEQGFARARREAEAMGRLGDHPHIVTIHDIGEDGGQLYIVSQYMAGGDVDELLRDARDHRLPIEEAMRIAAEVCKALEHAHAHGVVHRDIKPKNVWRTADGTSKLGDFGLAVALDRSRLTVEGMMVGTVAYMPPEQGLGRPADARSDLYSLGALLYEVVCGRPPFVGDDAVGVISQHINTAPVAPSWHNADIPRPLEELILRLLAKAPEERPQSASQVRQTLEAFSSGEFVVADPIVHDRASPLDRLATGVFVGRERETEDLRSSLEAILSGRGRVAVVAGEVGIGKTRLVAELATYARMRGAQVLWGRCYEGEGAPPYWPWIQIVRAFVADRDAQSIASSMGSGAGEIAQIAPEVRDRLPGLPQPPSLEPEQARFRLFDAVTVFLKNASTNQPLVLILDDLQWADRASLLLLRFIAGALSGARMLIVGTYRDAEVSDDHPLTDVLAALRRERDHKRIQLRGLSAEEVHTWLQSAAEHELGPNETRMVRVAHAETEGNPFFIEEIIRHLVETEQLQRHDGRWVITARTAAELGIPEGVSEVIGRRLSTLSTECNELLTIASVIGREFSVAQLEAAMHESRNAILRLIDEAAQARIVTEAPEVGRYRFAHGLTRETLYERMSTMRRVGLHAEIAEALESLHKESIEAHLTELAYHAHEAILVAGADRAIDFAMRAAARATASLAYEEAVTQYERALDAVEAQGTTVDDERMCDLLLELGDARWRTGAYGAAQEAFRKASDIAEHLGSAERLTRAALGYGGRVGFGGGLIDAPLDAMLVRALNALDPGDSPERAKAMGRLAEARTFTATIDERKAIIEEAVVIARRVGDDGVLGRTLANAHYTLNLPENLEERLGIAHEVIDLADRCGDTSLATDGHLFLVADLLEQGDVARLEIEERTWARRAEESRQLYQQWWVALYRAMRAYMAGRLEEAEKLSNEAVEIGQRDNNSTAIQSWGAQLAQIRREQGRYLELEQGVRSLVDEYPTIRAWRCALAALYAEEHMTEKAREQMDILATNDFTDLPQDMFWLIDLMVLAPVSHFLEDEARAQLLYDLLLPFAHQHATIFLVIGTYGSTSRCLGVLATVLKRYDEAARHFEDAIGMNEKLGARVWHAHSLHDYASMLLQRDEPGDRAKARTLINQSLEIARQCGLTRLTTDLLSLKLGEQGLLSSDMHTSIVLMAADVEHERPDLSAHAAPDGMVTIMFSDIEGSTEINERLGDRRWMEMLGAHNALVRGHVQRHFGYEVKSQGDGFMVAFSSARRAVGCAIGIQRSLAEYNTAHPDDAIVVRIGMHTGEAIRDADDFFGKNVVLAARIGAAASGGEILVSTVLKSLVEGESDLAFDGPRELELKGLRGPHEVFEVVWSGEAG